MNKILLKILTMSVMILLLSSPGLAATVFVTDYGANGSGLESSASANVSAFQSSFNAAGNGGTVIVPDGLYYINGGLGWDELNLTLKAQNTGGATLKRITAGTSAMSLLYPRQKATIEGLIFDGNRSTDVPNWSFGIRIEYGDNILIKDCTIQNCPYDGILLNNDTYNTIVDNCTIINNHRCAIAVTNYNHGTVVKNSYFSGNYMGLDFEPDWRQTGNHSVENCTFDNDTLIMFGTTFCPWNISVDGCNFINDSDFLATRSLNITATNNSFDSTSSLWFNTPYFEYPNDPTERKTDDGMGKIMLSGNTGFTSSTVNLLTNAGFDSWTGGNPDGWTMAGSGTVEQTSTERAIEGTVAVHLVSTGATLTFRCLSGSLPGRRPLRTQSAQNGHVHLKQSFEDI